MSENMGGPWLGSTPASTARKNLTSVISATGDEMATMNKTKFRIVVCIEDQTGGGYIKSHVYLFHDGEEFDLSIIQNHYHTWEGDGGSMINIWQQTPEHIDLQLWKTTDHKSGSWVETTSNGGTVEYVAATSSAFGYTRLRTNGTSGAGSTVQYSSPLNLDMGIAAILTFTGNFETATSLAFHGGVNADTVTAADSNTIKFQAEVCTATNNNWWLRTADGSTNSASDLGVAISTGGQSIKLLHNPEDGVPNDRIEISAADSFTKTTNIAITGSSSTGNLLKFSQKNSTTADRPYRLRAARLSYYTSSSWGYGGVNE